MLAADVGGRNVRLLPAQNPDDLLFRKPRSLHRPSFLIMRHNAAALLPKFTDLEKSNKPIKR
jgi:hypothetical protein